MSYYEVTYYKLIKKERVKNREVFKAKSLEEIKKYLVDDETVIEIGECEYRDTIYQNEFVTDIEFEKYKKRYNELDNEMCEVLEEQRFNEQMIENREKRIKQLQTYVTHTEERLAELFSENNRLRKNINDVDNKLLLEETKVHWIEVMLGVMMGVAVAAVFLV